jgi:hypothetical protein
VAVEVNAMILTALGPCLAGPAAIRQTLIVGTLKRLASVSMWYRAPSRAGHGRSHDGDYSVISDK